MNRKLLLSKFLSYILRHNPAKYNLELDRFGFTSLDKIIEILKNKFKHFSEEEVFKIIKDGSKGRFELVGNKIRARYGHSINVSPCSSPVIPPEYLYHGTSSRCICSILKYGLKPMGRKFVHLSTNREDAYRVGLRHCKTPIILKIYARMAYLSGIKFFKEGNVYLVKTLDKKFIKKK